jgi:DNA polymerase-4
MSTGDLAAARWVLHVDMDAFFASVEVKERPELAGKPVVVGGSGNRGVVASASYEARAYGVRSAMPSAHARRLCPGTVFLAPNFKLYQAYSARLHRVLESFTPLVEGIGLDEAFLDVTGSLALFGAPHLLAATLRRAVNEELGLGCAVGGGPNKLVAKLASKAAKPRVGTAGPVEGRGAVIVGPDEVLGFLWPLPVEAVWGIGRASAERLHKLGISTVGQLAEVPEQSLVAALGRAHGQLLHATAWGRDDRPVTPDRPVKSVGHEETYDVDVTDREELRQRLVAMSDQVAARLREHKVLARTVTLKLRYADFTTVTRSRTFSSPQCSGPSLWRTASGLLEDLSLRSGARLLGVSASGLVDRAATPGEQLALDLAGERDRAVGPEAGPAGAGGAGPAQDGAWEEASRAVDAVRARFGAGAVKPAVTLGGAPRAPGRGRPLPGGGHDALPGRRPAVE